MKLRKQSPRRAREARVYDRTRKQFLEQHRFCAGPAKLWEICTALSTDVHHKAGRLGSNYLDTATWLAVCRPCHNRIETHKREARALGLITYK